MTNLTEKHSNCFSLGDFLPTDRFASCSLSQLLVGYVTQLSDFRLRVCQTHLQPDATSALDSESERLVQSALNNASVNCTTITIAHRLSSICEVDKIFVFKDGEIVESGTHVELMDNEDSHYRQLVLAQEIEQLDDGNTSAEASHTNESNELKSIDDEEAVREPLQREAKDKKEAASLRQIFCFARPEWPLLFWGLLFTLVTSTVWPIAGILWGRMFKVLTAASSDDLTDHKADELRTANLINGLAFIVLAIVTGLCTFGSGFLMAKIGESLTKRLRLRAFQNLLSQDGAFYDRQENSTGELTTRLSTDAPNVQNAIDQRLADFLQAIFALLGGLAVGCFFSIRMVSVAVGSAFLIIILQWFVTHWLKERTTRDLELAAEASKLASESIEHVRTIQSLDRQDYLYSLFCNASEVPYRRSMKRNLVEAASYAVNQSYFSFHFAVSYIIGFWFINAGWISPFVIFQVVEAVTDAAFSIMSTASYLPEYLRARVAAALMFQMIDEEPAIDSLNKCGCLPVVNGMVEMKSVAFAYPSVSDRMVLRNLNLTVQSGQSIGLVGKSGSGKSTIIQLLERYYDPMAGKIEIDRMDIREANLRHLRDHIALVGQESQLFDLTIRENICYGLEDVNEKRLIEAAKFSHVHDFVSALPLGYKTIVGSRASQLSGGQRQRIAIARAVIRNPKILLLDEATASLDSNSEKLVQEALEKASEGRTSIVVAHRLSTIQRCDMILVLQDGAIIENGTHQQLLTQKGVYFQLAQKQIL